MYRSEYTEDNTFRHVVEDLPCIRKELEDNGIQLRKIENILIRLLETKEN